MVFSWWALRGSNPRPPRCKRGALANWAKRPHKCGCRFGGQQLNDLPNPLYFASLNIMTLWWAMRDLNLRPRHYQWRALTSWANRPHGPKQFLVEYPRPKPGLPHVVEQRGLEPRTPCLQSRCSSQLSYCPTCQNSDYCSAKFVFWQYIRDTN